MAWTVRRDALANSCAAEQDVLRFWRARRTLDCLTGHGPTPSAWRKILGRAGQVRPVAYGLVREREAAVEVPGGVRLLAATVRPGPVVGEFMATVRQPYEGIDLAGEVGGPLPCPECSAAVLVGCSRIREVGGSEGDGLAWILESDPALLPIPLAQHLRVRCHHPGGCPTVSVTFQRASAAEATGSLPFPERRTNLPKAMPGSLLPILAHDSSHYRLLSSPNSRTSVPGAEARPPGRRPFAANLCRVSGLRKPLSRTFRKRQHRRFLRSIAFGRSCSDGLPRPSNAPPSAIARPCGLMRHDGAEALHFQSPAHHALPCRRASRAAPLRRACIRAP